MLGKEVGKIVVGVVSALGGLLTLWWLFSSFAPKAGEGADWFTLLRFAVAVALAFGVTAMLRFALSPIIRDAPAPTPVDGDSAFRNRMAPLVLAIGSTAIILLALGLVVEFGVMAYQAGDNNPIKQKFDVLLTGIFSSVLPVFATWVGTVIAFYFTNESFRQAAQSAREANVSPAERLRSIPAKTAMTPLAKVVYLSMAGALDAIPLKDISNKFEEKGDNGARISRLLILNSANNFVGILHRSIWVELHNKGLTKNPKVDLDKDTLGSLIGEQFGADGANSSYKTYRDLIRNQVAFVGAEQTLADAKTAMEGVQSCQDIMVTQTGAPATPVIGWIMNVDIGRLSQP